MPQIKKKGTGAVNIKACIHNLGLATDKLLLEKKKKIGKISIFQCHLSKTDMIKANMWRKKRQSGVKFQLPAIPYHTKSKVMNFIKK